MARGIYDLFLMKGGYGDCFEFSFYLPSYIWFELSVILTSYLLVFMARLFNTNFECNFINQRDIFHVCNKVTICGKNRKEFSTI